MSSPQSRHLIQELRNPAIYPHPVDTVEVVQTHISWVIIAGDFVYKIKKAVDFGFLDFSTLRKRQYYCRQEVTLNRRLCPDLYLGVVSIRDDNGSLRIGGKNGRVVECAVQMHRLPRERMLDHLLMDDKVTGEMVDAIADKLAAFHDAADTSSKIARFGSERVIKQNWDENFEQTRDFVYDTITVYQFEYLRAWVSASITRNRQLFKRRVHDGHIRDGHGDLRASAICVKNGICIFDCIEFNHRFRYADVAADVAFLAMDFQAKGHQGLAERFVQRYVELSEDTELLDVLPFYASYRAYVRGKVESFRAVDPEVDTNEQNQARRIARDRFVLAADFAAARQPPLLLITCGLSGSGKSAVAGPLSERRNMTVIASDVVRKELAGLNLTERQRGDFQAGIYTLAFTRRTYHTMLLRARELLLAGKSVVLDATFSDRGWRLRAGELASETGAIFLCLECRARDEEIHRRLKVRETDETVTSDATWEIYLAQRKTFDPVSELNDWQHVLLDTDKALADAVAAADEALDERLRPNRNDDSVDISQ